MKIFPLPSGDRPAAARSRQASDNSATQNAATAAPALSADEITQAGLQSAQQTLNEDPQSDVDSDKVARMQAELAAGQLSVDTDALAADMLSFFQR